MKTKYNDDNWSKIIVKKILVNKCFKKNQSMNCNNSHSNLYLNLSNYSCRLRYLFIMKIFFFFLDARQIKDKNIVYFTQVINNKPC